MPVSVGYVGRETVSNLWRNRMMALAAVLTVSISLALVGTALLLRQAVNNSLSAIAANVNLEIFVNATAGTDQITALTALTQQTPQISRCTYYDHQQSYDLAKRLFAAEGDIVAIGALTPASTPPVFQCTLVHPNDAVTVANLFNQQPGVYHVVFPGKSIHELESVSNVVQIVLFVLALVLLISSVVLILNAIRMAIFARRREVGVMRLVGATAWFIRLPFMMEGLVQGVIGAAIAVGLVVLSNVGLRSLLHNFPTARVPSHDVILTEVSVVLIGILIGMGGSALAVRRFLRV